jgi:hypothetical protein
MAHTPEATITVNFDLSQLKTVATEHVVEFLT